MRKFIAYILVSLATVALAFSEANQHMGISGFLAIFVCQPWLALIWILSAAGVPVPDLKLSPVVIALMVGLNIVIGAVLLGKWKRVKPDPS
jgi:hypothetical protein